jgi:hypothetical protein
MPKKNTLLYLDAELVEMAKRVGMNISELAEAGLRDRLLPHLSGGQRALIFGQHLEDLKTGGLWAQCYELPFTVKSLRLKNVKVLGEFRAKFTQGVNLIIGGNDSGKTTAIRAIACMFYPDHPFRHVLKTVAAGEKGGTIELEILEPTIKYNVMAGESENARCVLLDEPLPHVDGATFSKHRDRFLHWLKERYAQVIIASAREEFIAPEVDNVIRLPGPVGKNGGPGAVKTK